MDNCLFCKIAEKKIPASIVYEDDDMLAFKDINPAAPVHLLLIPKQHSSTLCEASEQNPVVLGKLLNMAPKLAKEHGCDVKLNADGSRSGGYKTLINTGPDGGQEVYHLHLHVIGGPKPWKGQR